MTGIPLLLAVHISDGILAPGVTIAATLLAFAAVALASHRLNDDEIPRLGLFTAAVFAASQIHVPAGAGVSMHLLLNSVAGIILRRRAILAIGVAVFLQALLFAHGGLSTWGINTLIMALPAVLAGLCFRQALRRWPRRSFALGLITGLATSAVTILLSASAVYFFGIHSEIVVAANVLIQLPVVGLEGIITASMVRYLAAVKPEWLN